MAFGTFGFDKKNIDLNSSAFFEELQEVQVKKVTQHKRELTIRDLPEGITMAKVDIDNPPDNSRCAPIRIYSTMVPASPGGLSMSTLAIVMPSGRSRMVNSRLCWVTFLTCTSCSSSKNAEELRSMFFLSNPNVPNAML